MTKRDEIQQLKEQTRYQVQVIPDKGNPYALEPVKGHVREADARAALTDYVKAALDGGAQVGTDPRASEFPDAVYLTGTAEGHLRARLIERDGFAVLPAEESDALLAEIQAEEEATAKAERTATLEAVREEMALATARRDRVREQNPEEAKRLDQIIQEASRIVQGIEAQEEQEAIDALRADLRKGRTPAAPAGRSR